MVRKTKSTKHPLYIDMIKAAIEADANRKGTSKMKIQAYVIANYEVGDHAKNISQIIKMTIVRNVEAGNLVQVSGAGASGSFKLPKAGSAATKKASPKKSPAKKTAAKKPAAKKPAAKKAATKKTPAKKAAPAKKAPAKKAASKKKAAAKKKK